MPLAIPLATAAMLMAMHCGPGARSDQRHHAEHEAPVAAAHPAQPGLAGGGPIVVPHDDCVSFAQRLAVTQRIADNRERLGIPAFQGGAAGGAPSPVFAFYPLGVTESRDAVDVNFFDHDNTAGVLDFLCTSLTYDTHRGTDRYLRTFDEQAIGVPVFAALDGVVIDMHDGEPDMNTVPLGQPSNYVIIDHGYGVEAWYLHLRSGSGLPGIGSFVKEGQQIGLAGSSGNSSWPHLHFETYFLGQPRDPMAGPCNAVPSGFRDQDPFVSSLYLYDFGISTADIPSEPPLPDRLPVNAQVLTTDQNLYFWFQAANMPAMTTFRTVFKRPNGTIAYDSGSQPVSNAVAYRSAWFWFWYPIPIFIPDVATTPGTWRLNFYLAGQQVVDAAFEVVTTINPSFNRSPEDIFVSFDPFTPNADQVIICRVTAPRPVADKDFDVVRFRYEWKVNGGIVRDITSAGHMDALPRSTAKAGDTLSVTVTPNDGHVNGTPMTIQHTFAAPCPADMVSSATFAPPPDGIVDAADLAYLLGAWGNCN